MKQTARRAALVAAVIAVAGFSAALVLWALGGLGSQRPWVVLYSSMDDPILRPILAEFTRETGIDVAYVGDTEATKTTGLVERVLAERGRPRADVWWSNEPFGTMRLAREGALDASGIDASLIAERATWPEALRAPDATWIPVALRARVVAFRVAAFPQGAPELGLDDVRDPRFKGRIGIARPHFGTTRGHLGAIRVALGDERFRTFVAGLKGNGVRVYDGNSAVVRALAQGEIDVGLTDSDDVHAGRREGWAVDVARTPRENALPGLLIPTTLARVRGGPNPQAAQQLIRFLASVKVEEMLGSSEAAFGTMRGGELGTRLGKNVSVAGQPVPLVDAERAIAGALEIWDEVMGR